ncbi:MAG: NADH:ubiquinone oxidoreductase subunit NDUFA12 [Rhodobacteraceae bacterium]|nr:NADH:ubiquinone oxidoreductase subunit NDUFA12 [Paracoccaceae bacterium]
MGIGSTILRAVTWWDGQTLGTQLFTWRKGVRVGEDSVGNIYYHTKDDSRRWVIYNGSMDASRIDANWHGWLHKTFDEHPGENALVRKEWEKPHQENLSGTAAAYAPAGSIRNGGGGRKDYEAWQPE